MAKDPLMNLADAIVEDVLVMSDEEILAETSDEELAEAMKIRERALEAAHNGGLSAFGNAVMRPFFECPGCGKDIAEDGPHKADCKWVNGEMR